MAPQLHVVGNPQRGPDSEDDAVSLLRRRVRVALNGSNVLERASNLDPAVRAFLKTRGTGFRLDRGPVWLDHDGRAFDISSDEFVSWIAFQADAPAGAAEFAAAAKGASRTVCLVEDARPARAVGMSAVGPDDAIYVRCNAKSMFRVADDITMVKNGTHDLLLRPLDGFDDVPVLPPPTASPAVPEWGTLQSKFSFEDLGGAGAVILSATLASFLLPRELVGTPPAVAFVGPAGSGKTTAARVCLRLLCGRDVIELPPDVWSMDSFETGLARLPFMAIDDIDADPKFAALIRALITGGRRTRRKKYRDDDLHVLEPDTRLFFSTNHPPLPPTEANLSRLLPIRFAARSAGYLPEGVLEGEAARLRPQFWSDTLDLVRRVRPLLLAPNSAAQRLAGWERFVHGVATVFPNWAPHLRAALPIIDQVRADLLLADDIVAEYLGRLIPVAGDRWAGSASELLLVFKGGRNRNYSDPNWDGWSAERLAKRIAAIAPALSRATGIHVARQPRSASQRGYLVWRV